MADNKGEHKSKRTKSSTKKTTNLKKQTAWQRWNKSSITNKSLVIIGASTVCLTAVYLVIYGNSVLNTQQNFTSEHRPIVVVSRPPEAIDPVILDTNLGQFMTKTLRLYAKNLPGRFMARRAFSIIDFKIIPEKKTGKAFLDSPPQVDDDTCRKALSIPVALNNIAPGQEVMTEMAQGAVKSSLSVLLNRGDRFQIYAVDCVHYFDDSGESHGTCDLFRMESFGRAEFLTDEPIYGQFLASLVGHCST